MDPDRIKRLIDSVVKPIAEEEDLPPKPSWTYLKARLIEYEVFDAAKLEQLKNPIVQSFLDHRKRQRAAQLQQELERNLAEKEKEEEESLLASEEETTTLPQINPDSPPTPPKSLSTSSSSESDPSAITRYSPGFLPNFEEVQPVSHIRRLINSCAGLTKS